MRNQEEILAVLREHGVLLEGHFKLTSGRHAARYFQCAQLLQYPQVAQPLLEQLASYFQDQGVTLVAGPATGAIIISYAVGAALGVKAIFSERENGKMVFRRGFEIKPSDRVLVVEDVITTGGSTQEVIAAVRSYGATVVGVGCIADRSAGQVDFGVPFKPLVSLEIASYEPEACPLCAAGELPAVKPGSRPE